MYKVVEFLKTKEVELVPSVGIQNGVSCWPHLKVISLHSAIKQQVTPSQDWVSWEIRELFTTGVMDISYSCSLRNVYTLIREMLTKQEMILDQQQSILRILNAKHPQDTDYVIERGLLPVKDLQALNTLEQKLQSVDFKEKLINHLGLIGGCDTKDTVWRTMHRTISNDLAKSINWRGVNGKISLAALQIKDVVIDAVRKNVFSSTATNSEIENVMKRWLHLASDRDGGRKRRQKD
uniref:DUF4806 domain-containing protein n=1 Tax=Sinocyclocheilus grahami TaxID=75366 RepID=A0A672LHI4_SINGR